MMRRKPPPLLTPVMNTAWGLARRMIAALAEEYRMVALLYFPHEYSCQEIADCVGVPAGTVRPPSAPESAAHAEDVVDQGMGSGPGRLTAQGHGGRGVTWGLSTS